jgi:hypothetical protein
VKHLPGAPLLGKVLVSPTNIRIGGRGLPETNTPAYHEHLLIVELKVFVIFKPGANVVKLFTAVSYDLT